MLRYSCEKNLIFVFDQICYFLTTFDFNGIFRFGWERKNETLNWKKGVWEGFGEIMSVWERNTDCVCTCVCGVCECECVFAFKCACVYVCVCESVCVMKEIMQHFWKIETLDNLKKTKMILNLFRDLSFLLHKHGIF